MEQDLLLHAAKSAHFKTAVKEQTAKCTKCTAGIEGYYVITPIEIE